MRILWLGLLVGLLAGCGGGGGGSSAPASGGGSSAVNEVSYVYPGSGYGVAHLSTPATDSAETLYTLNLDLGTAVRDVYLVFSNTSASNTSTQPRSLAAEISHEEAMAQAELEAQATAEWARQSGRGLSGRPDVSLFNSTPRTYGAPFIHENTASRALAGVSPVPQPLLDVVGDTASFRLNLSGSSLSSATCRKVVTAQGKTLNIWVANNAWSGPPGCTRANCVSQAMVDALAGEFLADGTDNDIYEWVTNIFGAEWGPHSLANLISPADEITILLYDIDADNSTNGGTLGYYWSKDAYLSSSISGSNERLMFYFDSVLFAQKDGLTWNLSDSWPQEMVGTLAHEFLHMIHFYQKQIRHDLFSTETWLNEMCAMAAEDLLQTKAGFLGPRGVDWTDGTAGLFGNVEGRLPRFDRFTYIPVSAWMSGSIDAAGDTNQLNSYSVNYAFGSYLLRNFGGASLFRQIVQNNKDGRAAITQALADTGQGSETFETLLRKWAAAVLLSDDPSTDVPVDYRYNTGGFSTTGIGGIDYDLGSINLFNYHFDGLLGPKIYDTLPPSDSKAGTYQGANFFYRLGSDLTGEISRDLTLPKGTKLTVVVK